MKLLKKQRDAPRLIPSTPKELIERIRKFEDKALEEPQVDLKIKQSIHAGIYSRSISLKCGTLVTGALIKIETNLITSGDLLMLTDVGNSIRLTGYNCLQAEANRKQVFYAYDNSNITMYFKTNATTFSEAEKEFTDEYEKLLK
jgi:hypothetical protein